MFIFRAVRNSIASLFLLSTMSATSWAASDTIAELVEQSPDFTILNQALTLTGLKAALGSNDFITVFAPTDSAFNALPPYLLAKLLEDPEELSKVLRYHVVGAKLSSAALLAAATGPVSKSRFETLLGQSLRVDQTYLGKLEVEGSTVQTADIVASNGIVHSVTKVLIPPGLTFGSQTVEEIVKSSDKFTTLATALQRANLFDRLSDGGPVTLFAPTNAAFARISPVELQAILANLPRLQKLLRKHISKTSVPAFKALTIVASNGILYPAAPIAALSGDLLTVGVGNKLRDYIDTIYVEKGLVLQVIRATNGSVVVLDRVL